MKIKTFSLLFIILLIYLTHPYKHNDTTQAHQNLQQPLQDLQSSFKNHKKARIAEKQKFQVHDFINSLDQFAGSILQFFARIFENFILRKQKVIQKQSVVYRQDFASQNGGAQILKISSSKIKSVKAILRNNPDAYLFTADVLPISIVIGLKEEILIDSFVVQSGEVYSCIVQDFMLEGAFSLQNDEWIHLGNFTAQNSFEPQQFAVEQRIIRYLRLTILSSYGKWKYFTLTEIKVYGQGLFSHAMESLLQSDYELQKNKTHEQNLNQQTHQKVHHPNKFANKDIHTKEILVQAISQIADQKKQKNQTKSAHKNKLENENITHKINVKQGEEPHKAERVTTKQKKSISNLKKKISYLQKRNYQLHQEVKQLKKITYEKIIQFQAKHHSKDHKHHYHPKWYEFIFDSQSILVISMTINILCLILVGLLFKNKILSNDKRASLKIDQSQQKSSIMQRSKKKQKTI